MADPYYPRTPVNDFDRGGGSGGSGHLGPDRGAGPDRGPDRGGGGGGSGQGNYAKVYRHVHPHDEHSFSTVPLGEVITEQPNSVLQSFGSQISTGIPNNFGRPPQLPLMMSPQLNAGIPLPGFDLLDRIPAFKIHNTDGYSTCKPGYKIYNGSGDLVLKGTSDTLFCPFDSKQKSVYVKDANEDCIFHVKFTPSICECDSEEKRCFAVFSPVFENPFGAILFESGQLKYSLKILNALEAETFAVQFIGSSDITIKGADGSVVAIINIHRERCRRPKFTLTLMEEVSTANKALFIGCVITLDLVMCEAVCTRCICFAPIFLACLAILGLTVGSYSSGGPKAAGL